MSQPDKYKNCRNLLGDIDDEIKGRLDAFFENPSDETWTDVFGIIIGTDGWKTFWQCVIAVDPTFPKAAGGYNDGKIVWDRIPDFFTARRALEYAKTLTLKA